MKIILTKDVDKLGSLGDELEVKSGYARNFLIPQGLALTVNRENQKFIDRQRERLAKQRTDAIEACQATAKQLAEADLQFSVKSGDDGKLFGSITQKHISDALEEKGINLGKKKLNLAAPIKSLGSHAITVKLHTEVTAELVVKVVSDASEKKPAEGETEEVAEAAAE